MARKNKKYLNLKLKDGTVLSQAFEEYCEKAGLSLKDVGYHMGNIAGRSETIAASLSGLIQAHFFAGIYYGMTHSNKVKKEYLTEEDIKNLKDEPKEDSSFMGKNTSKVDYMG